MTMLWGVRHANTKDKDEYTWAQYNSDECRTHSWTRGSSVASGSLRPFGPVNRLGGGEQCHSKLCVEGGSSVIVVLVPRAFQKYSTCMVYSDFLLPGPSVFVFVFVFVFVYLHV